MTVPTIKLNDGNTIPVLGLGTWQPKATAEEVTSVITYALKEAGYRHLDCAWFYQNEKAVAAGIRASGVPRSEIFITNKVWCTWHSRVEEALDQTLANLGTDYLDLYLIHWPIALNPNGNHPLIPTTDGVPDIDHTWSLADTWRQMEGVLKKGKVRSIGVSNFSQKNLEEIIPTAEIIPAVNQLEIHAYNPEHNLVEYSKSKGIVVQAYAPLGSADSPILNDEHVIQIAQKHSLNPANVLLGYLITRGLVVLPRSVTPSRIKANIASVVSFTQKLDDIDMETLDGLAASGKQKRFLSSGWPVDVGFDNWP